jgi:ribosomal protein L11 methylase PrmA
MADRPGHFDLVFANILAKPLRMLAPSLARVASADGALILSGLWALTFRASFRPMRIRAGICSADTILKAGPPSC